MLTVRNLSKTYTTKHGALKALDDVSVEVSAGEIFGFIGLSGAGKTSLARCVSAFGRLRRRKSSSWSVNLRLGQWNK